MRIAKIFFLTGLCLSWLGACTGPPYLSKNALHIQRENKCLRKGGSETFCHAWAEDPEEALKAAYEAVSVPEATATETAE